MLCLGISRCATPLDLRSLKITPGETGKTPRMQRQCGASPTFLPYVN